MAAGAFISERYAKHLPLIEIFIGLYSICAAIFFQLAIQDVISVTADSINFNAPVTLISLVWVILIIPAGLIGFSVPLFTRYLKHYTNNQNSHSPFRSVYSLYNLGAAICILTVEYSLLRQFGITNSFYFAAAINIIIGILLLPLSKNFLKTSYKPVKIKPLTFSEDKKLWVGFILLSIISGLFQLIFLKVTYTVFGPHHENFAIVIALALLGITVGSYLSKFSFFTIKRLCLYGSIILSVIIILTDLWVVLWSIADNTTFNKIIAISIYGFIPFVLFGSLVPLLLKELQKQSDAITGKVLCLSSSCNCIGFLIMMFIMNPYVPGQWIIGLAPLSFMLVYLYLENYKKIIPISIVPIILLIISLQFWPTDLLKLSYGTLSNYEVLLDTRQNITGYKVIKKYNHRVSIAEFQDGERHLILDGYASVRFQPSGITTLKESIHGLAPALYSPAHDNALILGLGTGVTAGAAAQVFKHIDVVEINPTMFSVIEELKDENYNIQDAKNANFYTQDAFVYLLQNKKKYDSIINTVTGPVYFASSKLYTKDFFEMAKRSLKPGGTYSLWISSPTTEEGIKIIYQTLKESFSDCDFIFLTDIYQNIVCKADGPLTIKKPSDEVWSDQLKKKFKWYSSSLNLSDFLTSLIFPDSILFNNKDLFNHEWDVPANTLDRPHLQYSAQGYEIDLENSIWEDVFSAKSKNRDVFRLSNNTEGKDFIDRCSAFFIMHHDMGCSGKVMAQSCGVLPTSHAEAMLKSYLRWNNRQSDITDLVIHLYKTDRREIVDYVLNEKNSFIHEDIKPDIDRIKKVKATKPYSFAPFYTPPAGGWKQINPLCSS